METSAIFCVLVVSVAFNFRENQFRCLALFFNNNKKTRKKIFLINWNPNNIIARAKTVEGNSNFQSCYFFNYERNHFQCLSCPLAFTNLTVPLIFISLLHPGVPFLCALLPFYTHKTAVSFWKNKIINEPQNSIFLSHVYWRRRISAISTGRI